MPGRPCSIGVVFGLLAPNGASKSTMLLFAFLLRCAMDYNRRAIRFLQHPEGSRIDLDRRARRRRHATGRHHAPLDGVPECTPAPIQVLPIGLQTVAISARRPGPGSV